MDFVLVNGGLDLKVIVWSILFIPCLPTKPGLKIRVNINHSICQLKRRNKVRKSVGPWHYSFKCHFIALVSFHCTVPGESKAKKSSKRWKNFYAFNFVLRYHSHRSTVRIVTLICVRQFSKCTNYCYSEFIVFQTIVWKLLTSKIPKGSYEPGGSGWLLKCLF